ncbi:hypothetical protein Tco_0189068 [Tanacetum coccineum]
MHTRDGRQFLEINSDNLDHPARPNERVRFFEKQEIHYSPNGVIGVKAFPRQKMAIRLMLAPRSAMQSIHPYLEIHKESRNLPGSKFSGIRKANLETPSLEDFIELVDCSLACYGHFSLSRLEGYGRGTEGLVFGMGATTGATMGSRTGVVIGSGPTGGWTGVGVSPEPEVEAYWCSYNLANISVRFAIDYSISLFQFGCSDPGFGDLPEMVSIRRGSITTGVLQLEEGAAHRD